MLRNDLYKPWFLEDQRWGFEVISGDFQDVVVEVSKLEFTNEEAGNFDIEYHIINKPSLVTEEDVKGDLFKSTFELIINDIVREAIETFDENHRNDNTKEPDLQWRLP